MGNRAGLGILITCLAFLCFTLMDAIVKWIGSRVPVSEAFCLVELAACILTFLYGTRFGRIISGLRTQYLKLHMLRAVMYIAQFFLAIYALPRIDLADFYALIFTAPLFITALSALFLKEPVGWQRWAATVTGFIGVLVDLRPGGNISIVSFYVLASALLYGVDVICIRIANSKDSTAATSFYPQCLSLVPVGLFIAVTYQPVAPGDVIWLLLAGVFCGVASMMLVAGLRLASTPVAAPFQYTQLVWGVAIGWYLWHDIPDLWTWIGSAIIVGSGLYILHREALSSRGKPGSKAVDYAPLLHS